MSCRAHTSMLLFLDYLLFHQWTVFKHLVVMCTLTTGRSSIGLVQSYICIQPKYVHDFYLCALDCHCSKSCCVQDFYQACIMDEKRTKNKLYCQLEMYLLCTTSLQLSMVFRKYIIT